MKKILFLACVISIMCSAFTETQAQSTPFVSITNTVFTGNGLARDTVSNTAVKAMGTTVALAQGQNAIGIQVDFTKISGTLGGTVVPIASLDGVNWGVAGSASFTVLDKTAQSCVLNAPAGFNYYGVQWTGTGTMSGSYVGKVVRKTAY